MYAAIIKSSGGDGKTNRKKKKVTINNETINLKQDTTKKDEMTKSTLDELLKAPEAQIRSVLRALCSDRTIQRHALEHFDALKSEEGSGGGGQKRKAAGDLLICVQCGQPFTEEENDRKACWYHWGECLPVSTDVCMNGQQMTMRDVMELLIRTRCARSTQMASRGIAVIMQGVRRVA